MEILLLDGIVEGGKAIRPTIAASIRPYLKPEEALIYCNLKWAITRLNAFFTSRRN